MPSRNDYPFQLAITTRWMDNDIYGHLNNVVYYSLFDTAVNRFLIEQAGLDIHADEIVGVVVETHCVFHKPLSFPDDLTAGIRVAAIGRSSVRYEIGIFRDDETGAAAEGHFVHVYVERSSMETAAIPSATRQALEGLAR